MTALSDRGILEAIEEGSLVIDPFSRECLSPAGYDVRCNSPLSIMPGRQALLHTVERLELGPTVCGEIFIRSSFAREGVFGSFAVIDPGFKGQLTLSLANLGASIVEVSQGERIAQVVFHRLSSPAEKPYSGRYQGSAGTVSSKRGFK